MQEVRYAVTYWQHYFKYVMIGPTLHDVVRFAESGEDHGELSAGSFYELTDDGWAEMPAESVTAEREAIEAEQDAADRARRARDSWGVQIVGPEGVRHTFGFFDNRADAMAQAASMAPVLQATAFQYDH